MAICFHGVFEINYSVWATFRVFMCLCAYGGTPKSPEFTIKNFVFILTCLNFSHLQITLQLMLYTYWDIFPTVQNNFWTHRFWCLLMLLLVFCFTSPTLAKHISLWRLFSFRKTMKKVTGWDWVNREGGARDLYHFLSKLLKLSTVWAGALVNHLSWNRQKHWPSNSAAGIIP